MTEKINKNKVTPSARRKLVPATAMLMASAMALASSTYAWFTMSREVEVKNIQMTATVPEDIQISLGTIFDTSDASVAEGVALSKSTGVLKLNTDGNTWEVQAPREAYSNYTDAGVKADAATLTANDELDWSNTADISAYYGFGKLIPASSINGENIYFTPDAKGTGRELKEGAGFYQAAAKNTTYKYVNDSYTSTGTGDTARATSHPYTASEKTIPENGTEIAGWSASVQTNDGGYVKSTAWNVTNDDGYYIDIPVWLRTTSSETTKIYVTGYVIDKTAENGDADDTDDLYQAVRVAILDDTGAADKGCLTLADGAKVTANSSATYYSNLTQTTTNATKHILDSHNYNNRQTTPPPGIYALNAMSGDSKWAEILQNDASGGSGATDDSIGTLYAGTGTEYGKSKKFIIRVWLEGEDGNCWNANAGQDWDISLKFMKEALPES